MTHAIRFLILGLAMSLVGACTGDPLNLATERDVQAAVNAATPTTPEPEPEPERQFVELSLSARQLISPPLTVEITANASSFASFYLVQFGDGSTDLLRGLNGLLITNHAYVAAGTYSIRVRACEFESPDSFCAEKVTVVEVA